MADTTFTNGVTLTDEDWFNDVNRLHYTIFGDPANLAAVRTTLAASDTAAGTLEIAVQSEMETGTDVVRAVTPGRQHFHASAAKAWVHFTVSAGTVTVQSSYNLTGVTRNALGNYTITWATDFSGATYAWGVTHDADRSTIEPGSISQAAGTVTFTLERTTDQVDQDPDKCYVWAFGDHA